MTSSRRLDLLLEPLPVLQLLLLDPGSARARVGERHVIIIIIIIIIMIIIIIVMIRLMIIIIIICDNTYV